MKNKKLIAILGVSLLTLGGLTSLSSCKRDEGDPYLITFKHTFGAQVRESVEKYCAEFVDIVKKEEGIDLKVELDYAGGYGEIVTKVTNAISTGDLPTISVAYPDHVANFKALERGKPIVVDLNDYINDPTIGLTAEEAYNPGLKGIDDIVPSFLEEGTKYTNEGMFSFPFEKSTEILLFDTTRAAQLLGDMKISLPGGGVEEYLNSINWNQFLEILRYEKAHMDVYYPNDTENSYPLAYDSDANLFITQSYQKGIPFISLKDSKGQVDFNNDASKKMVQEFKDLYDAKILITKGTNEGKYTSDLFKDNRCTFLISSTGGTGYNDATEQFSGGVGVAKIPSAGIDSEHDKYVSQGITLAMFNNTNVGEEVNKTRLKYGWKLIKYLTSPEIGSSIALDSAGYVPCRYSSYETEDYADYLDTREYDFMPRVAHKVITEINGKYFNYPVFKGTEKIREQVGGIVTNVLLGNSSIDEAFSRAYTYSVNEVQ